ncbi:hypothetical protein NLU13_2645 [Sarocladium strictum]|uniref:Uncharacterized protein n=1 Tax=Sarocladium strictum TaxID=5046 RepID=A0AA39GLD7_SARSR|nr:hypothetical protein NLU13_2645 [Sarocladium strictum]
MASVRLSDTSSWASQLHSHHRPLLLHLNADTTWLLQLPYPASHAPPPGRTHLNILLDPWLVGPQSDVAWWFSTQSHVVPSSVATLADLNEALREVEGAGLPDEEEEKKSGGGGGACFIDVVFTDHCHRATLEELPAETTVFATDVAADLIRSWNHFDRVFTAPALSPGVSWTRLPVGDVPPWLAIGRVISPGNALYYHSAVLIAFDINYRPSSSSPSPTAEAFIYSPHGIEASDLSGLKSSGVQALALLHGMHNVRIWMTKQLNLGALNWIKAVGVSGAKYWIATHDEVKKGAGFIAPLLLRTVYTLKDAVATVDGQLRDEGKAPEYDFVELGSGDGLVLE